MAESSSETLEDTVEQLFTDLADLGTVEREVWLGRWMSKNVSIHRKEILERVHVLLKASDEAFDAGFLQEPLFVLNDPVEEHSFLADDELDDYRIIALLGEGGMGEVYLARDEKLNCEVAIKIVRNGQRRKETLRRFRAEGRILAKLNHPNIAKVLRGGSTPREVPFLVMEYVIGLTITDYVVSNNMSPGARLALFQKVCSAVQYLHQNLVIHRDIKPGNILVNEEGEPKLLDFGIAKLLTLTDSRDNTGSPPTQTRLMTPEYASPEQLRGDTITTASDVYSLGVLLYELLTGFRPGAFAVKGAGSYQDAGSALEPEKPSVALNRAEKARDSTGRRSGESHSSRIVSKVSDKVEQRSKRLDRDLDNIVLMALRKEPHRRYATVAQFSEDISRYLGGRTVSARKDTLWYRTSTFVRRNKTAVAATIAAGLILLIGTLVIGWEAHVAREQRSRAERRFNDVRNLANSFMFEVTDAIQDVPGSLAARQLLVERAVEYLDSLASESGNDQELEGELARAYDKVGSVTFDVEKTLQLHAKALALNERLVQSSPTNAKYLEQFAISLEYVADMNRELGRLQTAMEKYNQCLAVRQSLAQREPANPDYRHQLAEGHGNVALILAQMGQTAPAFEHAEKALELKTSMADTEFADASDRYDLLAAYLLIGRILMDKGDYAKALEAHGKALEISDKQISTDPQNTHYRRNAWICNLRLAIIETRIGKHKISLTTFELARKYIKELSEADPGDKGNRRGLAYTELSIGEALDDLNRTGGALGHYRLAIEISESLFSADAKKAETHSDLAKMHMRAGVAEAKLGDYDEADNHLQRARRFFEEETKTSERNVYTLEGLAELYARLGELSVARMPASKGLKDEKEKYLRDAREWYERSLGVWQDIKSHGMLSHANEAWPDRVAREMSRLVNGKW